MKAGDNKEFWQRTAKSYGSFMKHSWKLYDTICERIRPGLTREMNVLELACGSGQLSFRLAGRVRLWEATDFSENMIVEARKKPRSSRLHFSVQDATALLYAPDSFDAVVISNALHIMPHPELALAEIKRVLKPGGILYAPTFVHGRGAGFRLRAWLLPWQDSKSISNGLRKGLNGSFRSIIFKSDKQHCLAEALRRCAIWRQAFRNDKKCSP